MIQAAVEGVVDFTKARLNDSQWWKRTLTLLRTVERRNSLILHQAAFHHQLALVANSGLTNDSFTAVQERAQELFWDIVGKVKPWEGANYTERKKREFTDARQKYIDNFGVDPMDPQFQAWEAEQIRRLNAGEFDTKREDPVETVTRRMRERLRRQGR